MKLYHQVMGSGPALIWLHGLLGQGSMFAPIASKLNGKHYLLDLRNHEKSPRHPDCSYYAMASDLANFYTSEKIQNAILVGHSMGGKAALQFSIQNPDKVSKLILLDIAPTNNLVYTAEYVSALKSALTHAMSIRMNGKTRKEVIAELK